MGIGRRSAYRYAMGETAIPHVVVKLLDGDIAVVVYQKIMLAEQRTEHFADHR